GGQPDLVWLVASLLLAVLTGTKVWAAEQTEGNRRFMIDQRLSLTTVWLVKTLVALAGLVLLPQFVTLGTAVVEGLKDFQEGRGTGGVLSLMLESWTKRFSLMPSVWAALFFAAGQLCTIVFGKRIIAIVVAGAFAALLTPLWIPSLALGGLSLWHVLVGPAALLLACRLVLPAWCAGRLGGARPVLILLG